MILQILRENIFSFRALFEQNNPSLDCLKYA